MEAKWCSLCRIIFQLSVIWYCFDISDGKRLNYNLLDDDRRQFTLSTFGFLKKGTLDVTIRGFSYKTANGQDPKKPMFGFTLDKSKTKEVSSYIESMQDKCILADKENQTKKPDKSVSMVFFLIDHINNKLIVTRSQADVANLRITDQNRDGYLIEHNLHKRDTGAVNNQTRQPDTPKEGGEKPVVNYAKPKVSSSEQATTKAPKSPTMKGADVVTVTTPSGDSKTLPPTYNATIEFKLNKTGRVYSGHFLVAITSDKEEGLYNLFFHNCQNYKQNKADVNLSLEIIEDNNGNYLSAGEMPQPLLYFTFSLVYFILAFIWLGVLKKSSTDVFKIHFLMQSVVFVKSISCCFHGVNSYFIKVTGHHEETWAILYYIVYLFKGALMFVTILLIGAGWAFIKHMLSIKEKKLFLIVIPLQILGQVAWVIVEESDEGEVSYTTWKEIFILFDLLCCGAILFPVVWSIRHLQEGSRTDGKAAMNLNKLKLFRQFYILIVCFIYFTRIIVYLLKITLPFKLVWLTELFKEIATLIFFIVTAYKFRPATDNPYLQVPLDSDDEIEMEEVLTQTGMTEGLQKVNQRYEEKSESTEPLIKQRESSHEYD